MPENRLPIFFRYRLLWHILFWLVVFVSYWLIYAGYQERYCEEFYMNLIVLPARMIGTYSLIYLILPFAIEKRKFVVFSILVVIHIFLYGFLIYASMYYANPYPDFYDFSKQPLFNPTKILIKSASDYVLPIVAATIVLFKKWYLDEIENKKLAEEKVKAELSFLKSQIHPHFLFNTLNNLYALTLIKSDKTPDIVLKLADLMDYMIYKSNDEFVPLVKELEVLEGYVELEKMRYNERLDFRYQVNGEVDTHQIAPLILLPFIENCFKHGASKNRTKVWIDVSLLVEADFLHLKVVNSLPAMGEESGEGSEGIGLKNVRRRLELIYPDRHELLIKKEEAAFRVELKIFWVK